MKDKSIAVLGLGSSGEAAATLLLRRGARVTVLESGTDAALRKRAEALEAAGAHVVLGPAAEEAGGFDFAVISPGIDPVVPLVANLVRTGVPLVGELELAFTECRCPVIAITGTNGKTTTTELTAHLLTAAGLRTLACGNIGLPFSTAVEQSGNLDVMVVEVSSFQLETIRTFRPKVAAWLNLSPNHLDRYPGMPEYRAAKLRIFENQTADDHAVVNAVNDLPPLVAQTVTFSAARDGADFTRRDGRIFFRNAFLLDQAETSLPGVHNAENIMAALGIGIALGCDPAAMLPTIASYTPPSHRCEFVREIGNVRWVNDSKSTNLDAMEKALRSQDRPVVLIAGGKDKGFEFDPIAPVVREKVHRAVLIGEMKDRIADSWTGVACERHETLEAAVRAAHAAARAGDVVLFSPGTSSYDMFRSYIERGNLFKSLVHELQAN